MNFANLKTLSRGYVPQAKVNVISNTNRDIILNEGARKVARLTKCLPVNETFNVVADQREYDLSSVVTRYLLPDKPGLWWYDSGEWVQMIPKTKKWLDRHKPNWRDSSSGNPYYYYIDGDTLGLEPPPDTAGTDYFKFYFFQKPQQMSSNAHYPFGYDTEISRLAGLSEAILLYWRWKALRIVGKAKGNEIIIAKKDFYEEITIQSKLLEERPDISASRKTKMRPKGVPSGY